VRRWLNYNIEILGLLGAVIVAASTYGWVEARFIPTSTMVVPAIPGTLGHFSIYHLGLLILMLTVSSALIWTHLEWIAAYQIRYAVSACLACLPLSLMVEDIAWFITNWQPIHRAEWTMMAPGLGINLGFSWVPLWYIVTLLVSGSLLALASRYATRGYKKFLTASLNEGMMEYADVSYLRFADSRLRKNK
jgi:hypothetical protein